MDTNVTKIPAPKVPTNITMTRAEWKAKFKPGPRMTDLRGAEQRAKIDAAITRNAATVWTEVSTDNGNYIVNGWHFVNREAYFITEVPAEFPTAHYEIAL